MYMCKIHYIVASAVVVVASSVGSSSGGDSSIGSSVGGSSIGSTNNVPNLLFASTTLRKLSNTYKTDKRIWHTKKVLRHSRWLHFQLFIYCSVPNYKITRHRSASEMQSKSVCANNLNLLYTSCRHTMLFVLRKLVFFKQSAYNPWTRYFDQTEGIRSTSVFSMTRCLWCHNVTNIIETFSHGLNSIVS